MIHDSLLQVSTAQAVTATAPSVDAVDLGHTQPVGPGEPLYLVVHARTALTGTTPTLAVSIESDDTGAFASPTVNAVGQTLAAVALGDIIVVPFPWQNERFVRARYTTGGTTPAITVDAYFTGVPPRSYRAMPAVTGY